MLRTTINMRHSVFFSLSVAASRLGKTRRDVVVILLMKLMRDIRRFQGDFTLVRYQAPDPHKRWHCFSISFRKDENEFFTDLRKLCKFSVSHLVAIAVELYLDELLREEGNMHNYAPYTHYAIGRRDEGDVTCWELYWGDPGDIPRRSGITHIRHIIAMP